MTSRELITWAALHEQRARRARPWASPIAAVLLGTLAIVGWVAWRAELAPAGDPALASRAWLLACLAAFGVAFLRVPFHIYWRGDSALLAQLPIASQPLADVALLRCARAAFGTTLAVAAGTAPLARYGMDLVVRHLLLTGLFGIAAAAFVPAVVVWAASLVALDESAASTVKTTTGSSAATTLGAIPGGLGAVIIVIVLLASPWLTGGTPTLPFPAVAAVILAGSAVALVAGRRLGGRAMGRILRDTAALDRQRLASLEIRPPTALERVFAVVAGPGALVYTKDAQLVRRRYPLAFALGALAFLALVITGIAQPADPLPYVVICAGIPTAYGLVLFARLRRPPIELPRLIATLPITRAAITRAQLVWVLGWWLVFIGVPTVFAVVRTL